MTGWILVDIPPHEERLKLFKGLSLKVVNGEVVQNDDPVESMIALSQIAKKHIVDAEVEFEGNKYGKDDLFMYEEFQMAISEAANVCMKGLSLSKKL